MEIENLTNVPLLQKGLLILKPLSENGVLWQFGGKEKKMSNLQETWMVATMAWENSKFKGRSAKRKCIKCFQNWQNNGRKAEEKPPLFPPDYEGKCPDCGGELSLPFVPF